MRSQQPGPPRQLTNPTSLPAWDNSGDGTFTGFSFRISHVGEKESGYLPSVPRFTHLDRVIVSKSETPTSRKRQI
jgi:hypothetical protein